MKVYYKSLPAWLQDKNAVIAFFANLARHGVARQAATDAGLKQVTSSFSLMRRTLDTEEGRKGLTPSEILVMEFVIAKYDKLRKDSKTRTPRGPKISSAYASELVEAINGF